MNNEFLPMSAMIWTVERVKEELPKVKVRVNGIVVEANVSGRKLAFTKVWTKENHEGWEYSWAAIVRSLNDDRPLRP